MRRYPAVWALLLLLITHSETRNSEAKTGMLAVTFFIRDEPSLPEGGAELKMLDRSIVHYDTTLPSAQFHLSSLDSFRLPMDRLLAGSVFAWVKYLVNGVVELTNNSLPPNEIGQLCLYSEKPVVFEKVNTLTCFISSIFPPALFVTLQKNKKPANGEVNSSHLSYGKDRRFQVLHYTYIQSADGDMYPCRVLRNISKEEKVIYWEPEEQSSAEELDTSQLAVSICGLIIGILCTAVGLYLCFSLLLSGWGSLIIRINTPSQ
ncbi:RLA class II histocompatibility antigen, DP alpha-1 chain-like [Hemitrygon akajei]|uniref:RLA class II histocompatibility antigen, DP alpha-1 chain-like n=1 Tax=Hemitrygon akajei TaxID=2704970 RepID=UPI003BF9F5D1